jgi:dimeric dUTPase (all-alpha-NTP-PPase superfamily)
MNLTKLFEMQCQLDEHIEKEHPREPGEDRLAKKILALLVELGELAQEWRGFKYWSKDQKPRTELWKDCNFCGGRGFVSPANYPYGHQRITCIECRGESQFKTNPLLEEYVDCLHFILSIGLELGIDDIHHLIADKESDLLYTFVDINEHSTTLLQYYLEGNDIDQTIVYVNLFEKFIGLGEMLGFTWEQVEQAYLEKNKINHQRQEAGY